MQALSMLLDRGADGLQVQIHLAEALVGGALLLSVTGRAGQLLAQERLLLPTGALTLTYPIPNADGPQRIKAVLSLGDEVIAQGRLDLHISLAAFES